MKRMLALYSILFVWLMNVGALPYEEARDRARFLTDKMAYELNLNDAQYNDAYEINLDYFMKINTASDAGGIYWECRNADLRYILHEWQYAIFRAADYFFRPIVWKTSGWFYPICVRYRINHFYYKPPHVYYIYHGGHGRPHLYAKSFYLHRRPDWRGGFRGNSRHPITHIPAAPPKPDHRPAKPGSHHKVERPDMGRGNGFRLETVKPARTPQRGTPLPTRRKDPPKRQEIPSRYNRPSSTRTTVKKGPSSRNPGRNTASRGRGHQNRDNRR